MLLTRRQLALAVGLGLTSFAGQGLGVLHATPVESSGEVTFDLSQLANAGYSADVATFFSKEARFLPGVQTVSVSVNAGRSQEQQVRFDQAGQPCFDAGLLNQLNMRVPAEEESQACLDLSEAFPGGRLELRPGQSRMDVLVPQSAFLTSGVGDDYQRGGSAALLNYDLFANRYQSRSGGRGYFNARLEAGINVKNWAVRSRGSYSSGTEGARYVQQETYAQRPVEAMSSLLQVGQLSVMSEGFGGVPFWGAQLFSDTAQGDGEQLPVPIQGIADTHAVVEVRQRGQVVYRTVVSPGAYSISDVGTVTRGTDIEVLVTEEDGRTSRFVVPAPISVANRPLPATFRAGVGKYRPYAGVALESRAPWMVYGDYAFNVIDTVRLSNSALLAQGYQGAGTLATFATGERAWWGAGMRMSRTPARGLGHEWQVQGNASLGAGFYGGLSWQSRSQGFRQLEDTLTFRESEGVVSPFQRSLSASLSWGHSKWGSFSYSLSRTQSDTGVALSHALTASRRFGPVSASLSLQKTDGRGLAAFLNLQVPLGRDSLSARVYRYENGQQALGATYQGRLTSDVGYQVEASRSDTSQRLGASMQANTAYAALTGGVMQADSHTRSFYGSASGGMALTGDGMFAMSSGRISDTFALVKTPSVSGVRMSASGGSAKTSVLGTALVPAIRPYRNSRIQLDGKSLPLNYRFDTTAIDLKVARGTVVTHTIGTREMRQLMLTVRTGDNQPARVGSSIFNAEGDFMGTVVGDGNVILNNEEIGQPVYMNHHGARCEIRYAVPARFDAERPYEEAEAACI